MKSIWTTKYENNTIKVTNDWFAGEKLFVNDILQDKKVSLFSSNLTGHLVNSKNEKEFIKVNLFGWLKINCYLFVDDRLIEAKKEK